MDCTKLAWLAVGNEKWGEVGRERGEGGPGSEQKSLPPITRKSRESEGQSKEAI